MNKAKIQIHNQQWLDCEYVFSKTDKGHVLRITSPYRITLAIQADQPKQSPGPMPHAPAKQHPGPMPHAPAKQHPFKPQLPETPQQFITMAKKHSILAGLWHDIKKAPFMASVEFSGELLKTCKNPACSASVTSVTAKYCSNACKQSHYRLKKQRNSQNSAIGNAA